jgi:DNA-binding GntR family transcriptional regulator
VLKSFAVNAASRQKTQKPAAVPDETGADEADPAAGNGQPRYQQVARELKRAIAEGTYPVGARLPTELELCAQFGISRFTARGAVRLLSQAGLVTRRQRVGTVVTSTPDEARYTHDATSAGDLFQYAQDTQLRVMYVGHVGLSKAQARELGDEPGAEWIYAVGVRRTGDPETPPICVTRLFLNPLLEGIQARLRDSKVAIYSLIERDFGRPIERIEQQLSGVVLDADDAGNLGAAPGAPALRIVRRYYGDDGRLLELAENVHPSDRFTYRMELRK